MSKNAETDDSQPNPEKPSMLFWIPWGFDALIALVVLYFFLVGLADGSVSSFNMEIWLVLLLVVGFVMVGSLMLRSSGRQRIAIGVLMILAVPGFLCGLFFLVVLVANPRWN